MPTKYLAIRLLLIPNFVQAKYGLRFEHAKIRTNTYSNYAMYYIN